jgi:pimeloyl-ACP methyl ester carboxylesterase
MSHVVIGNESFHYRTSKRAPAEGYPAVCIHGSGAHSIVWSYQVSRLSKQYKIIAPDLPGHGESEGIPLSSAEEYAYWLDCFTEQLGLSSFFLLGHSFGGAIAQEYAHAYPQKVKGLILISTGTGFKLSSTYSQLHKQGVDIDRLAGASELPQAFIKGYKFLESVGGATLHADLLAAGQFDSSSWITSIKTPSLIIWGSSDIITPQELPENLSRKLPMSKFHIIARAGHVVMVEAPDDFNAVVKEFMNNILTI